MSVLFDNSLVNFIDRLICEIDTGLRTVFAAPHAERALPPECPPRAGEAVTTPMSVNARREVARLMRVNHTGEVCAQALYQGQALVARTSGTQRLLQHAAREERDHLAWCAARLDGLGGTTSRLNALFYLGSYSLGVASGLLGDKWSMGFLVETERQVEAHLGDHLGRWPHADPGGRAVLEAMQADEVRHGQAGLDHGAAILPPPIRGAMRVFSKVMTGTSYWV